MRLISRGVLALMASVALTSCHANWQRPDPRPLAVVESSLVRVSVTSQGHVFHRPWQQRRPVARTAIGVVVSEGQVLVQAALISDHRYIELETIDTLIKNPARVVVVDYESNLALLEPLEKQFLSHLQPMDLADQVTIGDKLTVLQVKPNGDLAPGNGEVTSIDLGAYSPTNFFLTYRLDNSLQYRFNNLTLPVAKGSRLAGLMLRQNADDRSIEVISLPVIQHFLEDARQGEYKGFPTVGFHFGLLLDAQLRRYLGMPESLSGIYVQKVLKGGPADRAGIRAGDVIINIGGMNVSNTGQYLHAAYGQTSLIHLLRSTYHVADSVPITYFRNKELLETVMVLDHRRPEEFLVPPYIFDRPPDYLIVGGLVMVELTMPYLQEYGSEWPTEAPVNLLFYSQNQDYLTSESREKIVIISAVIPTPETIGYENLFDLELLRVNGRNIRKLSDVKAALKETGDGYHRFEIKQNPRALYLDARQIEPVNQLIEKNYRIPIPSLQP